MKTYTGDIMKKLCSGKGKKLGILPGTSNIYMEYEGTVYLVGHTATNFGPITSFWAKVKANQLRFEKGVDNAVI